MKVYKGLALKEQVPSLLSFPANQLLPRSLPTCPSVQESCTPLRGVLKLKRVRIIIDSCHGYLGPKPTCPILICALDPSSDK